MAKRRIYKKSKNGEPIKVTARQLHQFYNKYNEGILTSRDYSDLRKMELTDSNVRDAIWALRELGDEILLGTWNKKLRYGLGKRIYIHYDGEDKKILLLSRVYSTCAK